MPEKSVIFEGRLPNGIPYKVHHCQGFVKQNAELAIEISDQIVAITTFVLKRSGNIEVIPTMGIRMTINPKNASGENDQPDQFNDQNQNENQNQNQERDSEPIDLLAGIVESQVEPEVQQNG